MRLIFLGFLALTVLPQTAMAQAPICAPTGAIVAAAVEARKAGKPAATARETITAGLSEAQAGFEPAVQPLVDWVYELPEADFAKDVAGSWVKQCKAQQSGG